MEPRVLRARTVAAVAVVVLVLVFQMRRELLPDGVGGR